MSYDDWKTTDPADRWLVSEEEREEGCSCPDDLGAGGRRKTDKWCPVHGIDPDEAYDRMMDDRHDRA